MVCVTLPTLSCSRFNSVAARMASILDIGDITNVSLALHIDIAVFQKDLSEEIDVACRMEDAEKIPGIAPMHDVSTIRPLVYGSLVSSRIFAHSGDRNIFYH
ncbi:hypothetical protein CEXT_129941 [Caerostris extrusa]|uniref:Uncharacterized protein n=1 Tax=Caerostris extrusa TaxID=172846 RepID=A0AAV4Q8A5_CAEEX|nr:hypothetical protein CEXT_129941 [Caerostris extrusa]